MASGDGWSGSDGVDLVPVGVRIVDELAVDHDLAAIAL
jgi:hypothetical protein